MQRNENLLLVYIPGDEEFIKEIYIKAHRTWFTQVEEQDLERLDHIKRNGKPRRIAPTEDVLATTPELEPPG